MMPFEIEVPYTMKPGMRPLKEGEPILHQDERYMEYIEQKKILCSPIFGNNVTEELHQKVLNYFGASSISQITELHQEDFVVWAPNANGQLSAQILSVCFPSGWAPEEKVNKTFAEIHMPVANNEMIMKAANGIASMITQKGPFVRSVWTVSNTPELSQHPRYKKPWTNERLENMYFRTERQVTIPLEDAAIFFIRVYVMPLLSVDLEKIRQSIYSMDNSILTYKNLHYVAEVLATTPSTDEYTEELYTKNYGQH